jgi:hypothetical protein
LGAAFFLTLATQEAEIMRIKVRSHPGEAVLEILSQRKKLKTKRRVWKSGLRCSPEFKLQYY